LTELQNAVGSLKRMVELAFKKFNMAAAAILDVLANRTVEIHKRMFYHLLCSGKPPKTCHISISISKTTVAVVTLIQSNMATAAILDFQPVRWSTLFFKFSIDHPQQEYRYNSHSFVYFSSE
jgi:hypothetical protein